MSKIQNLIRCVLKTRKREKNDGGVIRQRDIRTEVMSTSQTDIPEQLTLTVSTDIGTRKYQQDYCLYSTERGNFAAIVCDGMGGLQGSEQASKTAATVWMSLYKAGYSDFSRFANTAFAAMDEAVAGKEDAGGTTAAAFVVVQDKLFWMSVGDSKIYLVRDGVMKTLTREHNYQFILDGRLARGEINRQKYEKESQKGTALVSYIGRGQMPVVDICPEPLQLQGGDVILACSDGLYKSIPEERLVRIIESYTGDFDTLAAYLVSFAAERCATRDNTTVIAVRYNGKAE